MHCRMRYLLDFNLKIRSGQVCLPRYYLNDLRQHNNVDCRAVLWLVERLAEGRYIHSTVVWRCTREPKKSKWSQLYFHDCKEIITTVKTVRKKAQLIFQVRRQGPIHQMCCKKVSMLHVVSCCFLVVFYTFLNALIWIFFASLTYP